jgi:hypothetical protein
MTRIKTSTGSRPTVLPCSVRSIISPPSGSCMPLRARESKGRAGGAAGVSPQRDSKYCNQPFVRHHKNVEIESHERQIRRRGIIENKDVPFPRRSNRPAASSRKAGKTTVSQRPASMAKNSPVRRQTVHSYLRRIWGIGFRHRQATLPNPCHGNHHSKMCMR